MWCTIQNTIKLLYMTLFISRSPSTFQRRWVSLFPFCSWKIDMERKAEVTFSVSLRKPGIETKSAEVNVLSTRSHCFFPFLPAYPFWMSPAELIFQPCVLVHHIYNIKYRGTSWLHWIQCQNSYWVLGLGFYLWLIYRPAMTLFFANVNFIRMILSAEDLKWIYQHQWIKPCTF